MGIGIYYWYQSCGNVAMLKYYICDDLMAVHSILSYITFPYYWYKKSWYYFQYIFHKEIPDDPNIHWMLLNVA